MVFDVNYLIVRNFVKHMSTESNTLTNNAITNESWKSLKISNKLNSKIKPSFKRKPKWIRVKLPTGKKYTELRGLVDKYKLNTICSSGSCPNMGECWGEGTATFMILGNICTRSCGFCELRLEGLKQLIGLSQKKLQDQYH